MPKTSNRPLPRVFAIQQPHRLSDDRSALVPKFDLKPAEEYGELHFLLSPTASPFNPAPIIQELIDKLHGFGDNDYILAIGNPCLIGWAVTIAARWNNGRVRMLQWSGRERRYIAIAADLFKK